jgi:hypothetical protein
VEEVVCFVVNKLQTCIDLIDLMMDMLDESVVEERNDPQLPYLTKLHHMIYQTVTEAIVTIV